MGAHGQLTLTESRLESRRVSRFLLRCYPRLNSIQGFLAFDDYCIRRREACDRYAIVKSLNYLVVAFGLERADNRWCNHPIFHAFDYQRLHGDKDLLGRRVNWSRTGNFTKKRRLVNVKPPDTFNFGSWRQVQWCFNISFVSRIGLITRSHTCQPYTLSTLIYFVQSQNGTAWLLRLYLMSCRRRFWRLDLKLNWRRVRCKNCDKRRSENGRIAKEFDHISLFILKTSLHLPCLANLQLDFHLEKLAQLLSSYMATANTSAKSFIQHAFSSSC